jgi:hypothetical protein
MTEATVTAEPSARPQTKAATVQKLLSRAKGATLAELTSATAWQPHSARAFLTGLRKKGTNIIRECRPNGDTCWRIER